MDPAGTVSAFNRLVSLIILNGHEYLLSEENRQVELRYLYEDGIAYYVPLYDFNLKPGQFCQVWGG